MDDGRSPSGTNGQKRTMPPNPVAPDTSFARPPTVRCTPSARTGYPASSGGTDTPRRRLIASRTNKASPRTVSTAPSVYPDQRLGDAILGRSPGSRVVDGGRPSQGDCAQVAIINHRLAAYSCGDSHRSGPHDGWDLTAFPFDPPELVRLGEPRIGMCYSMMIHVRSGKFGTNGRLRLQRKGR